MRLVSTYGIGANSTVHQNFAGVLLQGILILSLLL